MKIPDIKKRNQYWNGRFACGFIYGKETSDIVKIVAPFLSKSKNILVFGGGYGRTSSFLAKKIKDSCVINIDVSANAIKLGRDFYKNASNLRFVQKNILEMKSKNSADAIVSFYLLSLFTAKEVDAAFKNIRGSLKDGGVLICNFLATDDDEYKMAAKTISNKILCDNGQQFVKFYKRSDVKLLFEKHNFIIKKIFKLKESRFIDVLKKNVVSSSWVAVAKKM